MFADYCVILADTGNVDRHNAESSHHADAAVGRDQRQGPAPDGVCRVSQSNRRNDRTHRTPGGELARRIPFSSLLSEVNCQLLMTSRGNYC